MRCPACNAENVSNLSRCTGCGGTLAAPRPSSGRVRRVVAEEVDTPFAGLGEGPNRLARLAYLIVLAGLVPGLGLLLGPIAAILGLFAYRRRFDPAFTAEGAALAAIILGTLVTLTNGVGLALMIAGWQHP